MNKTLLISEETIQKKVCKIAEQLNHDFTHQELIIVTILKGAICFVADLIRYLHIPFQLEFAQASSYGMDGTHPGKLNLFGFEKLNITEKTVLLIDDIFDTGKTLQGAVDILQIQKPKKLKTLVLLRKKVPRKADISPDYVCFDIEDSFVIGYGLDYKEHYRGLRGIYEGDYSSGG